MIGAKWQRGGRRSIVRLPSSFLEREITMTEFYCKCTPNGTASCGNIQSAADCDSLICTQCGGSDWSPRGPAGSEATTGPMTINITPVGCSTPEGAARVQNAMNEFADATANVANEADQILDYHDQDDLGAGCTPFRHPFHCYAVTLTDEVPTPVHAIGHHRGRQGNSKGSLLQDYAVTRYKHYAATDWAGKISSAPKACSGKA